MEMGSFYWIPGPLHGCCFLSHAVLQGDTVIFRVSNAPKLCCPMKNWGNLPISLTLFFQNLWDNSCLLSFSHTTHPIHQATVPGCLHNLPGILPLSRLQLPQPGPHLQHLTPGLLQEPPKGFPYFPPSPPPFSLFSTHSPLKCKLDHTAALTKTLPRTHLNQCKSQSS